MAIAPLAPLSGSALNAFVPDESAVPQVMAKFLSHHETSQSLEDLTRRQATARAVIRLIKVSSLEEFVIQVNGGKGAVQTAVRI